MMLKIVLFLSIVASIFLGGCDEETTSVEKDKTATNAILKDYSQTQPIPTATWSRSRQTIIEVQKNKIHANATYTVERATGTGQILRIFPSIGYPIPADTQLTNPTQMFCRYASDDCVTVEQAEPDGTYTSKNTDATYVLELLPDGAPVLYYSEQKLTTFAYPVRKVDDFAVEQSGKVPDFAKLEKGGDRP